MLRRVVEVWRVTTLAHELGLIPPGRLGPVAAQARAAWGLTPAEITRSTQGLISPRELRLLESGRLAPTDEQVQALFRVLGIALEEILPARVRLEIDRTQGRLVAGSSVTHVLPDATEEQLCSRYLCLVYALRRVRAGTFVVPRMDDLDVLAETLQLNAATVRLRLESMMRHHRDELRVGVRSLAGRAALPGLGLLVGMTALGALLMVEAQPLSAAPSSPPLSAAGSTDVRRVDIGTPMLLERIVPAQVHARGAEKGSDDGRHVVLSMLRPVSSRVSLSSMTGDEPSDS